MWDTLFLGDLTPKFYVTLTGTSSLISGLILIFEWWYFRKYGSSFIEQISSVHLGPWLGVGGSEVVGAGEGGAGSTQAAAAVGRRGGGECVVRRNPMPLLRGAEYARLWTTAQRAPLTYYDMNLTALEHHAWFGAHGDGPAEEALARAWRERESRVRVAAAREALKHAPDCAAALLLLAEEDAPTVLEAERVLRRAWRAAEGSLRGGAVGALRARDACVLAHVKQRAAACQRRLGRLRAAARSYRDLALEPGALPAPSGEHLLEVLLEQRAYPEAAAQCARLLDEEGARASVAAHYSRALLAARAGGAAGAGAAREALAAALAANAYVPEYLLELRPLSLPPEHVLVGGRSEALAYAFFHLRHWRACPVAMAALERAWSAAPEPPATPCMDRELLAGGVERVGGMGGDSDAAALLRLAALVCGGAALAAAAAQYWPALAAVGRALSGADPRDTPSL